LFRDFHTGDHWQWLDEWEREKKERSIYVSFWHDLYATTITYSQIQIEKKEKSIQITSGNTTEFFSHRNLSD
jgi:hypothetical protein